MLFSVVSFNPPVISLFRFSGWYLVRGVIALESIGGEALCEGLSSGVLVIEIVVLA